MIITTRKLVPRFIEQLDNSYRVDIASAWATEGPALRALSDRVGVNRNGFAVRAIIGIKHNITTPAALDLLNGIGALRIINTTSLFHVKTYIFHQRNGNIISWVGSPNFTSKGFSINEEIIFETSDSKSIVDWFDKRWSQCKPLDTKDIDEYRENYKPPVKGTLDERSTVNKIVIQKYHKTGSKIRSKVSLFENELEEQYRFNALSEALVHVIRVLSNDFQDRDVLMKIEKAGLHIDDRPLLSKSRTQVYWTPKHKSSNTHRPLKLGHSDWWLASDTATNVKEKFLMSIGDILGINIDIRSDKSYAPDNQQQI